MANNLIYNTEIVQLASGESAATSTKNTSTLDMKDADGVVFIGRYAASAGTNKVKVQVATATGSTFTSLATAEQSSVTDWRIDVFRPTERYMRIKYSRGTGGSGPAFGDTWAIQYNLRTRGTSTQQFDFHASPTT